MLALTFHPCLIPEDTIHQNKCHHVYTAYMKICNVLGTVAFGPEELENKGREDSSILKMGMKNLY